MPREPVSHTSSAPDGMMTNRHFEPCIGKFCANIRTIFTGIAWGKPVDKCVAYVWINRGSQRLVNSWVADVF